MLPGATARESDSPIAVFITCPPGNYTVNSTVEARVLVFNALEPFDPEEVQLKIGEDFRVIDLERVGTGVYAGVFTILDADIGGDELEMNAMARDPLSGDRFVRDRRWLPIYQEAMFNMEFFPVDPAFLFPMPGDEVTMELRLFNGTSPIDALPDSIDIEAYGPDWRDISVQVERVDVGRYTGRFTVDPDLSIGGSISVSASTRAEIHGWEVGDWDLVELIISRFQVWTHLYDVTRDNAHLDVFVRDLQGEPVPGASVNIAFQYFHPVDFLKMKNLTGTTGGMGRPPSTSRSVTSTATCPRPSSSS